jgi:hypothetical protein
MRRRITRALFTAAAAGATITTLGVAAASPAGAANTGVKAFTPNGTIVGTNANCTLSTPPVPSDNCGKAGYMATGRTFRFAQALINVPNHVGNSEEATTPADPTLYVALDNSGTSTWQFTRVGIAPCSDPDDFVVPGVTFTTAGVAACPASGWVVFAATADAGAAPTVVGHPLASAFMGDGILVNAFLVPTGNSVHTTITLPNGTTFNNTVAITGPVYTNAQATADWTTAIESGATAPEPAVPSPDKVRDTQFFQGRFTTSSGAQGTFNGPWTLKAWEATSNGALPPTGTLIGQPSFLWNDGNGFNGQGADAFGIWRFPF